MYHSIPTATHQPTPAVSSISGTAERKERVHARAHAPTVSAPSSTAQKALPTTGTILPCVLENANTKVVTRYSTAPGDPHRSS
jgi:hypothetical protein